MLLPERILLPIDPSARCLNLSWAARSLAVKLNARVILIDAARVPSGQRVYDDPVAEFWRNAADIVDTEWCFTENSPAIELVRSGKPQDLIMTSWTPGGFFQRLSGESPLEFVLRHSESAVWNSARPVVPSRKPRLRVACAIDLFADSERIALNASILSRAMGAELVLVHVIPRLDEGIMLLAAGGDLPATLNHDLAHRELESFRLLTHGSRTKIVYGDVASGLRGAVRQLDADLLVIGPGRQRPGGLSLGDNAFEIVRAAPCPVLVLDKNPRPCGGPPLMEPDLSKVEAFSAV